MLYRWRELLAISERWGHCGCGQLHDFYRETHGENAAGKDAGRTKSAAGVSMLAGVRAYAGEETGDEGKLQAYAEGEEEGWPQMNADGRR